MFMQRSLSLIAEHPDDLRTMVRGGGGRVRVRVSVRVSVSVRVRGFVQGSAALPRAHPMA